MDNSRMTRLYRPPSQWRWPQGDTHFPEDWRSYQRTNRQRFWHWTLDLINSTDEAPYIPTSSAGLLIDIGAHAGSWSLDLADRFQRIIAYEPEHWQCLAENAQFLGVAHIDIRPRCLSDHPEERDFYTRIDNSGDSGLDLGDEVPRLRRRVQCTTLDLDLGDQDLRGLAAVKIDVQGHEYSVLRGAESTIRHYQPCLCLELNEGNALAGLLLEGWGYELAQRVGKDWIWIPKI